MSTKAIRALLKRVADQDDGSLPDLLAAIREVEAIERAAKVVCVQGIYEAEYDTTDDRLAVERAEMLFERIAKEAQ